MTPSKKLIVRFKEGIKPNEVMALAGNLPHFERLYKIDNEIRQFKATNVDKATIYASDEELFLHEVYPLQSEIEKKISNTFTVDCANTDEAVGLYNSLQENPSVAFVQFDELNELYLHPNDPLLGSLWGISKINCEPAWDISQGEEIVVAVIDTGVDYNHPDIAGNIWTDASGHHGYDFSDNDDDPKDYHGHGSHCAGTISAIINNNTGVVGVAPQARIMAVKIFPNAMDSVCAQAIKYAADNGAKVLSNSWGPTGRRPKNQAVEDAIDYAHSKGCIVVFAAGNSNDDVQFYSPANYPKVIAVGATDPNDKRAGFSNYGALVSVAAPGVDILSLKFNSTGYVQMSGTSMACPHVSGLAALVLKNNPHCSFNQVKSFLQLNADAITPDKPIGSGRINAYKTVKASATPVAVP